MQFVKKFSMLLIFLFLETHSTRSLDYVFNTIIYEEFFVYNNVKSATVLGQAASKKHSPCVTWILTSASPNTILS